MAGTVDCEFEELNLKFEELNLKLEIELKSVSVFFPFVFVWNQKSGVELMYSSVNCSAWSASEHPAAKFTTKFSTALLNPLGVAKYLMLETLPR
jgi:hypothetical protein